MDPQGGQQPGHTPRFLRREHDYRPAGGGRQVQQRRYRRRGAVPQLTVDFDAGRSREADACAIAAIDDPQYIPVLREVYGKLEEDEVTEFYWTIRIMSGAEILKFRKQIREEVGVSRLGM